MHLVGYFYEICITKCVYMYISWPVHNNSSVACDGTQIRPRRNLQLCIRPSADNCMLTWLYIRLREYNYIVLASVNCKRQNLFTTL